MLGFRHDNDVPFYAYHLETMSLFMLITRDPRPPHDKQTMSPFMLIISGNDDVPFLCLSAPDIAFYAYQSVEKTFNRVYSKPKQAFFWSGLSGLSFRSRRNTRCHVLGLPYHQS